MSGGDNAAQRSKVRTVEATVAPGRTIYSGGKKHRPGDKVELTVTEASRFLRLGHVLDEKAGPLPIGNGPTFHSSDGPSVKVQKP